METVISIGDIHGDFKVILEVLFNELHKRKGINKLMFQLVTNDNVINIVYIYNTKLNSLTAHCSPLIAHCPLLPPKQGD